MFFIRFKNNNDIDNPTIIKNFNTLTKLNLKLSKSEISHIRTRILDDYNNLNLLDLVEKIKKYQI